MKNFISHKFSPKSSNSFVEWSRFSFGTDAKLFAVLQCSGGTIWGEKKAYKWNLFFSFSEIWNFPTFWGKLLFERTAVFKCFPVIEARHFRLLAEKFQYGPQNRILRLEGKSLRNKLFHGKHYDVFLKLRHQAKTFRPFDDFFSPGFQKCILRVGRIIPRGRYCKKCFYLSLLDTELENVDSWREFFSRILKTCLLVSRRAHSGSSLEELSF